MHVEPFRAAVAMFFLAPTLALADAPPTVRTEGSDAPTATAVRVAVRSSSFAANALQLEGSRFVTESLAIDLGASVESMGRNDDGFGGELLGRWYFARSGPMLSLALGPALRAVEEYGPMAFAVSELGLERRLTTGLNFLVGAGLEVAVSKSRTGRCGELWFCKESFSPGTTLARFHFGVGGVF